MGRRLLFAAGALGLLAAFPHAFLGWPPIGERLRSSTVDPDLIDAIFVGWHFGSVAMAALGLVVLAAASEVTSHAWAFRVVLVVGLSYLLFGVSAFFFRSLNPHFLVFVAMGLLIIGSAIGARRGARRVD